MKALKCLVSFAVLVCVLAGCAPAPEYSVIFDDRHNLQEGDRVIMNGVAIGQVRSVRLESPKVVACAIRLDRDYRGFLNKTAVFTYDSDPDRAGRMCLLCKNCDEMAPAAQPGDRFEGMGVIAYTVACLGNRADAVWMKTARTIFQDLVKTGGDFSEEARRKIETFARTNGPAFEKMLHDFNDLIQELDTDARETLDEIREKYRR